MREEPIAVFGDAELGAGLQPSQPGRSPTFWKDGSNVSFFNRHLSTALGQFLLFNSGVQEPISGLRGTFYDSERTAFFGTPTKLRRWTETAGVEDLTRSAGGTPYTGSLLTPWQFARWGTWMVASNNTDVVQVYKNTGDFVPLSTPFTRAKALYATDQFLLVFNTNDGGNIVQWCDLDDIETWTALETNLAGAKPMRNLDSDIIAAKKLNDTIVAYTENELFAVDFIGAPNVFGTRLLTEGFGPVGIEAIAAAGSRHYGWGRGGIWITDGYNNEFVDIPALRDYAFKDAATRYDKDKGDMVRAVHVRNRHAIRFYYATEDSDQPNLGIELDYLNKSWSKLSYGYTAADDTGVFPFLLAGDFYGNVFHQSVESGGASTGAAEPVELDATYDLNSGVGFGGVGDGGVGGSFGTG